MKTILTALLLAIGFITPSMAHDEGHGPKLSDTAKYGGAIAPAILAKEVTLGRKAKMIYKGELTRSQNGTIRIYIYDTQMKLIDLEKFDTTATGTLEFKKNKKWAKTPFKLQQKDNAFVGKLPPVTRKPFNIDVILREGNHDIMIAFDHLD